MECIHPVIYLLNFTISFESYCLQLICSLSASAVLCTIKNAQYHRHNITRKTPHIGTEIKVERKINLIKKSSTLKLSWELYLFLVFR